MRTRTSRWRSNGDAAYGVGELLAGLERTGTDIKTKVQPPNAPGGRFPKDRFAIDLAAGTVTCPGAVTVHIRPAKVGGGTAAFGAACAGCPLAAQCTSSSDGRTITIGRYQAELTRARTAQTDPAWQADYRATRPKVERKIGHLMRRRHGGRRARVRGRPRGRRLLPARRRGQRGPLRRTRNHRPARPKLGRSPRLRR